MENKYDTKEIDSNFNISYDKFTVYVNRTFLGSVFNESKKVFKNKHELSKYIIKKYNLKRYNARNLAETFTRRWINGMRSIPLDYLLALCEIAKKDKKEIYKNILSIKFAGCRIPIEIKKFPLKLNTHWAFISECIRCEGALDGKRMTLENTSTEIISEFRNNLYQIGVGNENIKEHISVKVQVPNDLEKNDIKVFNSKGEMRNFHMRVLNLRKGIKKEIIFTDKFKYEKNLNYQILTKTNKININVLIPKYGKIEAVSDYSDKRYKNVSPSVVLVVCNKTAVWILNNIFEIPLGKKSSIIRIPEIIKNSTTDILRTVINIVFACESTISVNSKFVSVTSISKGYLKDLQGILLRFNINSTVNGYALRICGLYNFKRLENNFNFIIDKKNNQLEELLMYNSEQTPKHMAELFYLKSLKELGGEATWNQILKNANRKGNSLLTYKNRLIKSEDIKCFGKKPKILQITNFGENRLKNSNMNYWND